VTVNCLLKPVASSFSSVEKMNRRFYLKTLRAFLYVSICCTLYSLLSRESVTAKSRVVPGGSTSLYRVGIIVGERMRRFTDVATLDEYLSALSADLHLCAFVVTDSGIQTQYKSPDVRRFRVLQKVHLMSGEEVESENEFASFRGGVKLIHYPGLLRQWYKLSLAYADLCLYEKEMALTFTHILRVRSDLEFSIPYPLDSLDLASHTIFMNTDLAFIGRREYFPDVLISAEVVKKYWNRYDEYFRIDPRVLAASDVHAARFTRLCLPAYMSSIHVTNAQKQRKLDALNKQLLQRSPDATTKDCAWGGAAIPFASERVFLLNILVKNITVSCGLPCKLRADRHVRELAG